MSICPFISTPEQLRSLIDEHGPVVVGWHEGGMHPIHRSSDRQLVGWTYQEDLKP